MERKRDKYGEFLDTQVRPGELATGQLSFQDEDRVFVSYHLPRCPACGQKGQMEKKRFGSQNKYRVVCQWSVYGTRLCPNPADTPWLNNHSQAAKVWRMNVLLAGGNPR